VINLYKRSSFGKNQSKQVLDIQKNPKEVVEQINLKIQLKLFIHLFCCWLDEPYKLKSLS